MLKKTTTALLCALASLCFVADAASAAQPASTVRTYGILKVAVEGAYGAPESFGRPNFSAVTNASHPLVMDEREALFTSFQVAQTRFGLKAGEGTSVVGTIEVDFIDFALSTPTTTSKPRLRVASIDWKINARNTLSVGQQWDLFAHLNPHHFNLVGANFTSGNLSFMRDQIIWHHKRQGWEFGAALGLPGANGAETLNNLERGLVPTASARFAYKPNEKSAVGITGLATSLRLSDEDRLTVWGGALYAQLVTASNIEVRGEAYIGQNMANIGQLSLATGSLDNDVREFGAWTSIEHKLSPKHRWHITLGGAQIINEDKLAIGYVPATVDQPATRSLKQGLGIRRNLQARLGWVSDVGDGLNLFVEPYALITTYKLDAADSGTGPTSQSFGAQSGLLYKF